MIYEGTGGPDTWKPDETCFLQTCAEPGECIYSFAGSRDSRVEYNNTGDCVVNKDCQVPDQVDKEGNPCTPAYMTLKEMAIIYACGTVIMHIQTVGVDIRIKIMPILVLIHSIRCHCTRNRLDYIQRLQKCNFKSRFFAFSHS